MSSGATSSTGTTARREVQEARRVVQEARREVQEVQEGVGAALPAVGQGNAVIRAGPLSPASPARA